MMDKLPTSIIKGQSSASITLKHMRNKLHPPLLQVKCSLDYPPVLSSAQILSPDKEEFYVFTVSII